MTFTGKHKTIIQDADGDLLDQVAEVEDHYGNSFSLQKDEYQSRGILPSWESLPHCSVITKQMLQEKVIKATTLKNQ